MAINIPIITEFSDAGIKSARGAFDQFKTKVGEANGAMGKLKAGSGVAFDAVKANAGSMALGAGAAIAGFAAKAIGDFQDMALSVDKFRNTTGLTLDQSSQWISYTGDLGIQADSMVKIFNRLGKAATDQLPAFKELGVEIAFGPDGAADLEETFLRVNDAINSLEDPVAQAKYRADLFGRGWMDAAEIINMSSEDIQTSLAGVKDFEVIDEKEIQKAKDLRAAQDELSDAFAEIAITVGSELIPALTKFLPLLTSAVKIIGAMGNVVGPENVTAKLLEMGGTIDEIVRSAQNPQDGIEMVMRDLGLTFEEVAAQIGEDLLPELYFMNKAWIEGYRAMIDAHDSADELTDALMTVDDALAELKGEVDERQAWRNLIDTVEDVGDAARKAFEEATPEALRASEAALDKARLKVGEYIAEIDGIPDEQKTEFIASLDQAKIDEIEQILNNLGRVRQIPFMPTLPPGVGGIGEIGSGGRPIGEAPISFGIGTRAGVTVNVAGSVISEGQLVETVRKGLVNAQRNGAGLVYTNS